MTPPCKTFLAYVDAHQDEFVNRLGQAVAIQSVSGDPKLRPKVVEMGNWLEQQLKTYGVETQKIDLNTDDMAEPKLPPIILGKIGDSPDVTTILVYGHYDVQPAKKSDGWDTDPFELKVMPDPDGRMIGRGSSDDKGPVLGWINVLEAHHQSKLPLPVNLRFCFEGMEESGSTGLEKFLDGEIAKTWFAGVNSICISDNTWLTPRKPAVTYGLRGIIYYAITVSGPIKDLHSGEFGGMVHEPLGDLIHLLGTLVRSDGKILIPKINDQVPLLTDEEKALYEAIDFEIKDVKDAVGDSLVTTCKVPLLTRRMRYPSLSLHGIEGALSSNEPLTVIPHKVTGRFSIRLVPNQTVDGVHQLICEHLRNEFAKLKTQCKMCITKVGDGAPWLGDVTKPPFKAAKQATEDIYGKTPDFTREGGSIPVTVSLANKLHVDVVLLPMGRSDDGAHSFKEKLDKSNFIKGTKLLGTYMYKLSEQNI
ncbi:hypothetical protein PILCRDRAFT_816092 [Piloderma croceum F 1598]|uniref:Peptidase M20 dimerisation domain-containing protein n=1 Tax=Piloderma croceum (strain F 1598) TaxID=765440 RepID=A0A0C3BKC1_PILCF|nr:hypothetical protein PILCRDRAFT_816092 [Piloderma croceum F 1598]